ncbi:MAG: hypothetical protein QM757_14115 [Paludibaculum sp.]
MFRMMVEQAEFAVVIALRFDGAPHADPAQVAFLHDDHMLDALEDRPALRVRLRSRLFLRQVRQRVQKVLPAGFEQCREAHVRVSWSEPPCR